MAGQPRAAKHTKSSNRRKHATAHRRSPYQWLGVGAVSLGMGLALTNGTAIAYANESDSEGTNGTSSDQSAASTGTANAPTTKSAADAARRAPGLRTATAPGGPRSTPAGTPQRHPGSTQQSGVDVNSGSPQVRSRASVGPLHPHRDPLKHSHLTETTTSSTDGAGPESVSGRSSVRSSVRFAIDDVVKYVLAQPQTSTMSEPASAQDQGDSITGVQSHAGETKVAAGLRIRDQHASSENLLDESERSRAAWTPTGIAHSLRSSKNVDVQANETLSTAAAPGLDMTSGNITGQNAGQVATGANIVIVGAPTKPPAQPIRDLLRSLLTVVGYSPEAQSPGTPTAPNPVLGVIWGAYRRIEATLANDTPTAVAGQPRIVNVSTDGATVEGSLGLEFADINGDPLTYTVSTDNGDVDYDAESGEFVAHLADPTRPANITVTASDETADFHLHGLGVLLGGGHTVTSQTYQLSVVWDPDVTGPNRAPQIIGTGDGWIRVTDPDGDQLTPTMVTGPTYGVVVFDSLTPVAGEGGVYQLNYHYSPMSGPGALFAYDDHPDTDMFTIGVTDGTETVAAEPLSVAVNPDSAPGALPALDTTSPIGARVIDGNHKVVYQTVWDQAAQQTYVLIARSDHATPTAVQITGTAPAGPVLDPSTGYVYQTTTITDSDNSTVVVTVLNAEGEIVATHEIAGVAGVGGAPGAQVVIHDGRAYQTVFANPSVDTNAETTALPAARTAATSSSRGTIMVLDLADPGADPNVINPPGLPSDVRIWNGSAYVISTVIENSSNQPVVETYVTVLNSDNQQGWTRTAALPGLDIGVLGGTSQSGFLDGKPYLVTMDPSTATTYITIIDLNNPEQAVPQPIAGVAGSVVNTGEHLVVNSAVQTGASTQTAITVIDSAGNTQQINGLPGSLGHTLTEQDGKVYVWLRRADPSAQQSWAMVVDPSDPGSATPVQLPDGFTATQYMLVDDKMVFLGVDTEANKASFVVVDPAAGVHSPKLSVPGSIWKVRIYDGKVYAASAGPVDGSDPQSEVTTWLTRIDPNNPQSTDTLKFKGQQPTLTMTFTDNGLDLWTVDANQPDLRTKWRINLDQYTATKIISIGDPGELPATEYNAPPNASQLYTHLRDVTKDTEDGMYIERIDTADGPRYIVYLGGTDDLWGEGNQGWGENAAAYLRAGPKDDHLARLRVIRDANPDAEIMLVGYSQGGMDAQNIAETGEFNVTTVVTYGCPIITIPTQNYKVIHLQVKDDPVAGAGPDALENFAESNGARFAKRAPWRSIYPWENNWDITGVGLHMDKFTYEWAGAQFELSSDPRYKAVKDEMARFHGRVDRIYPGTNPGESSATTLDL